MRHGLRRIFALWRRNWPLILSACFAVSWIIHRAMVQSITLDEASTYRIFVAPAWANYWMAHSNNHVLNSMLIRLFVGVFGLSHLTVRLPALLGGCVYIFAAYQLCILLCRGRLLA